MLKTFSTVFVYILYCILNNNSNNNMASNKKNNVADTAIKHLRIAICMEVSV